MAKLRIGSDENGPFVRMTSNAFDPDTLPDTDYDSWRYNSRFNIPYFVEAIYSSQMTTGSLVYYDDSGVSIGAGDLWVVASYDDTLIARHNELNGRPAYDYPTICDQQFTLASGWSIAGYYRARYQDDSGFDGGVFKVKIRVKAGTPYYWTASHETDLSTWRTISADLNSALPTAGKLFITGLPADDVTPIPGTDGVEVSGQRVVEINETAIKVARRGFDATTADDDELLIGGAKLPNPVYKTGRATLSAKATTTISLPVWLPDDAHVMVQYNRTDRARLLPPMWIGSVSSSTTETDIEFRIVGASGSKSLEIYNDQNREYEVLYIVLGQENPVSEGFSPAIKEGVSGGETHISIVQADGRIAADSRWSYLPIVQSGIVDVTTHNDAPNNTGAAFSWEIPIVDLGYVPFVLYSFAYGFNSSFSTGLAYTGPRLVYSFSTGYAGSPGYFGYDHLTNTMTVEQDNLTFTSWFPSPYETDDLKSFRIWPHHVRYYVFAIPDLD